MAWWRLPDKLNRLLPQPPVIFISLPPPPNPGPSTGFGTYPGRKRGALQPQVITFPCPACQGDVELGERGLAGLFRNLTLERVVERYRQSVSVGGAILCQLCKPPPLEATKGCTECRATFCNECFKLFHPWGTQKAQHEPTLPTLSFRPKVSQHLRAWEGRGMAELDGRGRPACGLQREVGRGVLLPNSVFCNNQHHEQGLEQIFNHPWAPVLPDEGG